MNVTLLRRPHPNTEHQATVPATRPWPETIAGVLMGMVGSLQLAFTPLEPHLRWNDPVLYIALVTGALIGGGVSWRMNRRPARRRARAADTSDRAAA
jgi:hypothetical protein